MTRSDILVIGAGVIGLTCALRLADEGRAVTLVDPEPPGSGASYGNAGTIADYAVMPVGTPDVLRDLPRLLFDRHSPLAIRRASMVALAPWLLRFLWQSLPRAAARNAAALAHILSDAAPRWAELGVRINAQHLMLNRGCLYAYATAAEGKSAEAGLAVRRDLGVTVERLTAGELAALEPGLPPMEGGAAFFPNARFLTDPGAVMAALAGAAEAAGVEFVRARVDAIAPEAEGVVARGQGFLRTARQVVVAAGAHARGLARMAGSPVPLDTERGYHLEFDGPSRVTRPTCATAPGFYLCPMAGRMRVAGTVELGGLTAPPSPHRTDRLLDGARRIFPDLPAPSRTWMGFRPSMPDSLPVIGPARDPRVILAFGHGHLGVTLAPRTAAAVADLAAGRDPGVALRPCRAERF
jgi:D-amino-acid dehydrogenase